MRKLQSSGSKLSCCRIVQSVIRFVLQCGTAYKSSVVTNILSLLSRCELTTFACRMTDLTCITLQIRTFVDKYYQFIEGVAQYQRDIDELLGKVCNACAYSCPLTYMLEGY